MTEGVENLILEHLKVLRNDLQTPADRRGVESVTRERHQGFPCAFPS
jgi:hypothetical protein